MTRSLSSAISGIDANQQWLDNISNNIANSNTDGYQSSSIQFADLLYQQQQGAGAPQAGVTGGTNPIEIGSGVKVASTQTNFAQGTLQQTGNPTDLAIQGQGFLVVAQGGQTSYTRAGSLQLDASGQLVTPTGAIVQGWTPNAAGVINQSSPIGAIAIPQGQAANPVSTQNITLGGNLPVASSASQSYTTTTTAYDSLGSAIPITVTFTPVSSGGVVTPNEWNLVATTTNAAGTTTTLTSTTNPPVANFSSTTGQITSITNSETTNPNAVALTGFPSNYSLPSGYTMNLDLPTAGTPGAVTQFAGSESVQITNQDGSPSGSLTGFSIGSNGTIDGSYANGKTQVLGQISLATFANPEGLAKIGNLMYQATLNSGNAQLGSPSTGGRGSLVGGSVETSNVNLGTQLTDLIVAQTGYQANTKVVSTTATVLQALVQMA
ncbi:MAG: flagellar hook protein FlgE [Ferrimicrobium sp.]